MYATGSEEFRFGDNKHRGGVLLGGFFTGSSAGQLFVSESSPLRRDFARTADFPKVLQNYHSLAVNLVLSMGRTGTISLVATVGSPS